MENPWNIQSLYEFQYFNCPSCDFKNHSKQKLVNHAYEIHPESIEYLMNLDDKSISDIEFPWNDCKIDMISQIKIEEPDTDHLEEIKEEDLDQCSNTNTVDIKSEADCFVENSESNFTENPQEIKNKKPDHFGDESNCVETLEDPLNIKKVDSKIRKRPAKAVKDLNCDYCGKIFSELSNLKRHIKAIHEGIKAHKCEKCGKSFSQAAGLKIHIKGVHEGVKHNYDHHCDTCGKSFTQSSSLKIHVKSVHEGIKDHICDYCQKSFAQAWILKTHIQTVHEGVKAYDCNYCSKSFALQGQLNYHIKSHLEGVKKHKCILCGKGFSRPDKLKAHIKSIHEGVKDYFCNHCGKGFSREDSVKKHIKDVHDGVKDHICVHCEKRFSEAGKLKRHVKAVHEGVKDHLCSHCEQSFSSNQYLKTHIKVVHEGVKDYICMHCGKAFGNSSRLKKHIRNSKPCTSVYEILDQTEMKEKNYDISTGLQCNEPDVIIKSEECDENHIENSNVFEENADSMGDINNQ